MDDKFERGHLHGFGEPQAAQTKLQGIVIQREQDVAEAKAQRPEAEVRAAAEAFVAAFGPPQGLAERLAAAEASPWKLALAAEFKRASPSKGDINVDLDAAAQALEYTKVGASVLSVLTEPKFFKGSLQDLKEVRLKTQEWAKESGQPRPACLRKDFLIDEYQVLEAVAHGADTALLMVSILARSRLKALIECCRAWGMEPLVEVVTCEELQVALDAGARVLGVNNRNLHTFELDKTRTAKVAQELQTTHKISIGAAGSMKVLALSGLATAEDVAECRVLGCSGVLIGEALMRAPDPGVAILELMGGPLQASGAVLAGKVVPALPVLPGAVVVKVCGVVDAGDARCAITAGANLIGVIFAKSKRQASPEQAAAVVQEVQRFGERKAIVGAPAELATENGDAATSFAWRCGKLRSACRRTPLVVGVFMDQPLEEIVERASATGVDAVQLHGAEPPEFVSALRARLPHLWVFKVVHLPPRTEAAEAGAPEELKHSLLKYAPLCHALLLDTAVKGSVSGGTGQTFDWSVARHVQDAWGIPVIVAGGLTDSNVGELVSSVGPFGVDVASGVEDAPGKKNAEKTTGYVQSAKRARIASFTQ